MKYFKFSKFNLLNFYLQFNFYFSINKTTYSYHK